MLAWMERCRGICEFYAAIAPVILYLRRVRRIRALGVPRIIWLMIHAVGTEGIGKTAERRERKSELIRGCLCTRLFIWKRKTIASPLVCIASVSCCAGINREMMHPAPGEMSSGPVMASCTRSLAPRYRRSVFTIIPQLFIASRYKITDSTSIHFIHFKLTRYL